MTFFQSASVQPVLEHMVYAVANNSLCRLDSSTSAAHRCGGAWISSQAVGRTSTCWHEHKAVLALQRSNQHSGVCNNYHRGQPAGS